MKTNNMQIINALAVASVELQFISDIPKREARWLLSALLAVDETYLLTHETTVLSDVQYQAYLSQIAQRKQGYPLAYLLGYQDFWSLRLKVTEDTLIPRADTEILVDWILSRYSKNHMFNVLDLGTGTGAIALVLAFERPHWQVTAIDQSSKALAVAKENAELCGIGNVRFLESDWYDALDARNIFDVIVSNPPYIDHDDPNLCEHVAKYEPSGALIAEQAGYADLHHIIQKGKKYLSQKGLLVVEHGFAQGEKVSELFHQYQYRDVKALYDLSGHWRATIGYNIKD